MMESPVGCKGEGRARGLRTESPARPGSGALERGWGTSPPGESRMAYQSIELLRYLRYATISI